MVLPAWPWLDAVLNWLAHGTWQLSAWQLVVFTLLMTHITIASVTIYLHRHQAHRSLDLHWLPAHFFRLSVPKARATRCLSRRASRAVMSGPAESGSRTLTESPSTRRTSETPVRLPASENRMFGVVRTSRSSGIRSRGSGGDRSVVASTRLRSSARSPRCWSSRGRRCWRSCRGRPWS